MPRPLHHAKPRGNLPENSDGWQMTRTDSFMKCDKGFFVSFDYTEDAERKITRFHKEELRTIIPLTVNDLLEENFTSRLA